MPSGSTRHRVAIVIALVGVAVSAVAWHIGRQLDADSAYTSFCTIGGVVDCDRVIGSQYGKFLGVSVGFWAVLVFAAGIGLSLPGALGAAATALPDLLLLALVAGSVGFAAVLLVVAAGVLGHVCLVCLTLDAVIVAWFVTALPLARRFAPAARDWLHRRATAHAAIVGGLLLSAATGSVDAMLRSAGPSTEGVTPEYIKRKHPDFYKFYRELAKVAPADVLGDARHAKGPAEATVTIVEFSDFECPACRGAFGQLHTLLQSRRDIRVVFRNFPLDQRCNRAVQRSLHPDACLAAVAAECAGQQGRFWEYHDLLFTNQQALDRESLFHYAREAGLEIARFRTCLDDPASLAAVTADIEAGTRMGVDSTPTLFINGRRVAGALEQPFWSYALVLEAERSQGGS